MSIGERCVNRGYGFYGPPDGTEPFLISPYVQFPRINSNHAKKYIYLEVHANIPYLT